MKAIQKAHVHVYLLKHGCSIYNIFTVQLSLRLFYEDSTVDSEVSSQ